MTTTATTAPPTEPPLTLRPYQVEAVDFLRCHPSAGLFLDMGLGKTAISLRALTPAHLPVLVTAPPRPAESVWPQETAKWRPDLRCVHATGKDRTAVLDGTIPADIVTISREQLTHARKYAKRFNTFIIDELSGFKTRSTTRWRNARAITKDMPHTWGLTGTPTPNGLLNLWPQMFILDRGETLGTTLGEYRSRYFTAGARLPSGVITEWNIRPGAATRIHERLRPNVLSMGTEGRVHLPPVTTNDITVELPAKARAAYEQMKTDLVTTALADQTFTAANAAVLGNKLRQLASGSLYPDERDPTDPTYTLVHQEKLKPLEEIVESAQGSPVLTAYAFRFELEQILDTQKGARQLKTAKDIDDWNAGKIPMLVVHPASAGHGLNLQQGGHTMAWYSLPWSLEEYQQTNKRLARSGQQHPVVIHHIMTHNTVDAAVLASLQGKESIQTALLQYLDPEGVL